MSTQTLAWGGVMNRKLRTLDFVLPKALEASEPPEARGLRRDDVQLMVSYYGSDVVKHGRFHELARYLNAGDVLVINTSGTLNAALPAWRKDGSQLELHLSTRLPAQLWSVELRQPAAKATKPFYAGVAGEQLRLPDGGQVTLHTAYNPCQRSGGGQVRLWLATLQLPVPLDDYLSAHGYPIRYSYVHQAWPADYYQTVYVTEMGSAEMPSAGRAFTPELLTRLVAKGVQIVPLLLHTGVASLEDHEPPYEEYYRVSPKSAEIITAARRAGQRIVGVGTTAVRALETVTDENGITHAGEGWTDLIVTPTRGVRGVDGLLTGLHEPEATHLAMLAAVAGESHLKISYAAALEQRYLWHEFGDLHLLLP